MRRVHRLAFALVLCPAFITPGIGGAREGGEVTFPTSPPDTRTGQATVNIPTPLMAQTTPTNDADPSGAISPQHVVLPPSSLDAQPTRPDAGSGLSDVQDPALRVQFGACPVDALRNAWGELAPLEHSAIETEVLRLCTTRAEAITKVLQAAADIRDALGNLAPTSPPTRGGNEQRPVPPVSNRDVSNRDDAAPVSAGRNDDDTDATPLLDNTDALPSAGQWSAGQWGAGQWEVIYTVRTARDAASATGQGKTDEAQTDKALADKIGATFGWIAQLQRVPGIEQVIQQVVPGRDGAQNGGEASRSSTPRPVVPRPRETRLVRGGDRLGDGIVLSVGPEGVQVGARVNGGPATGDQSTGSQVNGQRRWFLPWAKSNTSPDAAGGADWIVERVQK